MKEPISFRPYLIPTLFLMFVGWGGLGILFTNTYPTLWPRWAFFALVIMAATGTFIPVSYLFNRLFTSKSSIKIETIVRESVSVGVYFAFLSWMSIGRALNTYVASGIALALLFIEYILRLRESSITSENDPPQSTLN